MIGNLNDRVDWELIGRLARERPDWTLAIVGPVYNAGDDDTLGHPAARSRCRTCASSEPWPSSEIPATIAAFDVGLIPYRMSAAVERINPLKLYQYLAAGKPVVSTAIPTVERFGDVVAWCRSHDEFVTALSPQPLAAGQDPARCEAGVAPRAVPFTWDAIAQQQLDAFERALEQRARRR